jgi:hypothetical protein
VPVALKIGTLLNRGLESLILGHGRERRKGRCIQNLEVLAWGQPDHPAKREFVFLELVPLSEQPLLLLF